MSVVIYKRSDTDFSLGSIFTLFEERFDDVVDQIAEMDYCSYNSICERDHNGAYEDCLFLSNVTCENSNQNLSRSVYFGRPFDNAHLEGFYPRKSQARQRFVELITARSSKGFRLAWTIVGERSSGLECSVESTEGVGFATYFGEYNSSLE